jgi:hypothetical protein
LLASSMLREAATTATPSRVVCPLEAADIARAQERLQTTARPRIALLADLAVAVLGAPGVAVGVGIPQVTPVLAALLVGVCDWNTDHLAVHIRKHRMVVRTDGLTAAQDQRRRSDNDPQ